MTSNLLLLLVGFVLVVVGYSLGAHNHIRLPEREREVAQLIEGVWTTHQYDADVEQLEVRRRAGPILQEMAVPYVSRCASCGFPWTFVEGHYTDIGNERGMFPICEWCWKRLRLLGRDDEIRGYYRELFESWPVDHTTWEEVAHGLEEDMKGARVISVKGQ